MCISLPVPVELFDFCLTVLRFIFFFLCCRELLSFKISKEIVFLISSFEMNQIFTDLIMSAECVFAEVTV